jgi:4-amino-4-deoxy-L-arabinose transferase-like glycosyltransferase
LQSWKNFFFVAAEPGGAVSIDKPPLGFWLQAAFAYALGVSGFSVVLPEIICGLLSMVAIYHLVRRSFGAPAGLLSALAMAINPIFLGTERNNTIDCSLILVLLLAAWAFILATESGKLRYLILGGILVGLGFNIKMLQAYLPLPAFLGLYFLGAKVKLPQKLFHLSLSTLVLIVVSLSWVVAVDLTPASQRPYVGSSGDNSEFTLAFGYNGLDRLTGMGQDFSSFLIHLSGTSTPNGSLPSNVLGDRQVPRGVLPGDAAQTTDRDAFASVAGETFPVGPNGSADGTRPAFAPDGANRPGFDDAGGRPGAGNPGGGGFPGTGAVGILRLFISPLSKETSWLLPCGLLSMVLLVFPSRIRWPLEEKHRAVILWGGWLMIGAMFFSIAGFFHEYYLSMLAAPLAALVGIGIAEILRIRSESPRLGSFLLLATIGITITFQIFAAAQYIGWSWWLTISPAFFVVGGVIELTTRKWNQTPWRRSGIAFVVAAMLFIPAIWTGLTALSENSRQLPSAYNGGAIQLLPPNRVANAGSSSPALLAFLEKNTQGMKYLLAVPSSQQGAEYVLASGRPVLYLGGFNGSDQVLTNDALASLIAQGDLRYILLGGNGGPNGGSASVISWITGNCKVINPSDNASASTDGQGTPGDGGSKLYDCH